MLTRLQKILEPGCEASMGDFANFNLQHTLEVLSTVYSVLEDICVQKGIVNVDIFRALRWCQKAHLNQAVYFPDAEDKAKSYRVIGHGTDAKGKRYSVKVPTADKAEQTHQGMFSGHRGTSFDNTMLNIGYFNTAASAVADRWGVLPERLHRVHTGDDIWVTNHNVVWAAMVYDQMVASGLVLQPVKQLFSTRGEFLRLLYTREGISGYLCRSIVSWTTNSIQDTAGLDIVTRVEETDTIVSTLYRRGALVEPLMRLRDIVVARACRIKTTDDKRSS